MPLIGCVHALAQFRYKECEIQFFGVSTTYVRAVEPVLGPAGDYDGGVLSPVHPDDGDVVFAEEAGARDVASWFDCGRRFYLLGEEVLGFAQVDYPDCYFWIRRFDL